jgi:hypothetical protein
LSDISKTIRDKGFVSFYCQVSDTGSVGWASSMLMPRLFPSIKILKIWWKKGNNSEIGNQIFFKISG